MVSIKAINTALIRSALIRNMLIRNTPRSMRFFNRLFPWSAENGWKTNLDKGRDLSPASLLRKALQQ